MISLLDLPLELIFAILDDTRNDRNLLFAVSFTCQALRDLVSPLLYSNIHIQDYMNLSAFAEKMLNNSHLASLVISFVGPIIPTKSARVQQPPDGWLQNMVNLKSLHLTKRHDNRQPFPKVPFRLTSLEVNCSNGLAFIESFLKDQTNLESISVGSIPDLAYKPLSPLACPNLKVLRGNINAARSILPGRRVARLDWKYTQDEPIRVSVNLLNHISDELSNLRSLSYSTESSSVGIHPLYIMSTVNLRSLRFLEIEIMYPQDWEIISSFPNLRVFLVLEPFGVFMSMVNQPALISELFSKCATLQRIDVGRQDKALPCSRWVRDKSVPNSIPLHIAEEGRMEFLDDLDCDDRG
ncbi:hypothetical protein GALMADRAFT_558716 [Galerina marginata CBS 339.88]|uniref:F-box domain-containing protein n=1 Tax=Galerina marginata (strain CBS 339.88) TaxID=685588 RepID=A0A067T6I3_GALM3|nr:hypothetical protein GALMADRAFT_558716 [Galerina marginata CBS 339.88]